MPKQLFRRMNGSGASKRPNSVVVAQVAQYAFMTGCKLRLLDAADKCERPGQSGALLRREGLYSPPLTTWQRWRQAKPDQPLAFRPALASMLCWKEKRQVQQILNAKRFVDSSSRQMYDTPLDTGEYDYYWHPRHLILFTQDEAQKWCNQCHHSIDTKPDLLATASNQLWFSDTRLVKRRYYYLCIIVNIFSCYVLDWLLTETELTEPLIAQSCGKYTVQSGQLTLYLHQRGPITAKAVAQRLADLEISPSYSHPHTDDINPFLEADFKILKDYPDCPTRFKSLSHTQAWTGPFFNWDNHHDHASLALTTSATASFGLIDSLPRKRQTVLDQVYHFHPKRFAKERPTPPWSLSPVWINSPKPTILLASCHCSRCGVAVTGEFAIIYISACPVSLFLFAKSIQTVPHFSRHIARHL